MTPITDTGLGIATEHRLLLIVHAVTAGTGDVRLSVGARMPVNPFRRLMTTEAGGVLLCNWCIARSTKAQRLDLSRVAHVSLGRTMAGLTADLFTG